MIVTIGALVVTAVVVAGLAFWPATSTCLNGGGDLGSCVQQSLAERGVLPMPEVDQPVTAEPEPDEAPVEIADPDDPALDAPVAPVIDARVETDGSTILAGTVEPNVDVHLFFNGVEVGQTTSDSVGDWVFIPDQPLPIGGVAITLGTGVEGEEIAEVPQALAVVIDGETQPTVTAAAPDELSALIEELTGSPPEMASDEPMEMAAIGPDEVPEVAEPETAVPDADLLAPETETAPEATEPAEDSEPAEAETAPQTVEEPAEQPVVADEPGAEPDQPASDEPAADPATTEDEPMQTAAVEPDQMTPDEPVTAVPPAVAIAPTIDAVEIDPDRSYIAGAGQDGSSVRLYVEDQLVGESPVEGNRWLVETDETMTEPSQRIRAEMIGDDGMVMAEAEINFVVEQPEQDEPATDGNLILPDDQLSPMALPTEPPLVVAELPEATEPEMAAGSQDLILPDESLSSMSLPTEAPNVEVGDDPAGEPAEEPATEVADAEPVAEPESAAPEETLRLSEDQLAPIELPTEAPLIAAPAVQTPDEPAPVAEAPETVIAHAPEASFILPEDQLAPIAMPTEAPPVDLPTEPEPTPQVADVDEQPAEEATDEPMQTADADAQPEPVVESPAPVDEQPEASAEAEVATDDLILPEDQLAPIALPTEAPNVDIANVEPEVAGADPAEPAAGEDPVLETAEAEPLRLPEDQLPPIELPAEAPPIVTEAPADTGDEPAEVAEVPAPVSEPEPVRLPDDQLPEIALPTEAPPVDEAESDAAPVPAPAPLRLPADQLPEIALPTEAPPVPAVRPEAEPVMQAEADAADQLENEPAVEAEEEVPTLVATPVGDPVDGRFASGKVIIRRGDNLWTISRRVYGRGIQYTMIFDANREKISNPNLIFPGQVFDLPGAPSE